LREKEESCKKDELIVRIPPIVWVSIVAIELELHTIRAEVEHIRVAVAVSDFVHIHIYATTS
jgi:hypothetical protein